MARLSFFLLIVLAVLVAVAAGAGAAGLEPHGDGDAPAQRQLSGGFGKAKPADGEVTGLLLDRLVTDAIEAVAGPGAAVPGSDKTQVVAGDNYLVYVVVDGKDFTVKIFKPLPHKKQPLSVAVTAGNSVGV